MSHEQRYYADSYAYPISTFLLFILIFATFFGLYSLFHTFVLDCPPQDIEKASCPKEDATKHPPSYHSSSSAKSAASHSDEAIHHMMMSSVTANSFFKLVWRYLPIPRHRILIQLCPVYYSIWLGFHMRFCIFLYTWSALNVVAYDSYPGSQSIRLVNPRGH
jgi:hypothetical protein